MTRISASWLEHPTLQLFAEVMKTEGYQALFVGGCVRNALFDLDAADIDIATDALPDQTTEIAQGAGLKVVPTGLEHGTVTVVGDDMTIEVTTFRQDIETDGRHAVVGFTNDVAADAARRDFTMNALYADISGRVIDPVGGLNDLKQRRVRFVGEPRDRVTEDYLRIMRFFRFTAWYGDPDIGLDPDGLDACTRFSDKLETISAERIGSETLKTLASPTPDIVLAAMQTTGVLAAILPGAEAAPVARFNHFHSTPNVLGRLAALGGQDVTDRLRLTKAENRTLTLLLSAATSAQSANEIGYRLGAENGWAAIALRAAIFENLPICDRETIVHAAEQTFPLRAADLQDKYEGKALGDALRAKEQDWIESGFLKSKEALLS